MADSGLVKSVAAYLSGQVGFATQNATNDNKRKLDDDSELTFAREFQIDSFSNDSDDNEDSEYEYDDDDYEYKFEDEDYDACGMQVGSTVEETDSSANRVDEQPEGSRNDSDLKFASVAKEIVSSAKELFNAVEFKKERDMLSKGSTNESDGCGMKFVSSVEAMVLTAKNPLNAVDFNNDVKTQLSSDDSDVKFASTAKEIVTSATNLINPVGCKNEVNMKSGGSSAESDSENDDDYDYEFEDEDDDDDDACGVKAANTVEEVVSSANNLVDAEVFHFKYGIIAFHLSLGYLPSFVCDSLNVSIPRGDQVEVRIRPNDDKVDVAHFYFDSKYNNLKRLVNATYSFENQPIGDFSLGIQLRESACDYIENHNVFSEPYQLLGFREQLQFVLNNTNKICMICGDRLYLPYIKPTVCEKDLCRFTCADVGRGFSPNEIVKCRDITNLWVSLIHEATYLSNRVDLLFSGKWPNYIIPQDRSYTQIEMNDLLQKTLVRLTPSRIDKMACELKRNESSRELLEVNDSKALQWLISLTAPIIMEKLTDEECISEMLTSEQYLVTQSTFSQESNRKQIQDIQYRFHGSSFGNWYSILLRGLNSQSGTKFMSSGKAYGNGVYLGADSITSSGYAQPSTLSGRKCLAFCAVDGRELRNHGTIAVTDRPGAVVPVLLFIYDESEHVPKVDPNNISHSVMRILHAHRERLGLT